jgi:simple sugar transport system permease protein
MGFTVKIEKRLGTSRLVGFVVLLASILLALLFGAVLLAIFDADPWDTYVAMFQGAFGTVEQWNSGQFYSVTETLVKAIPLTLTGLSVAIAFRMLFWNIGAEGQLVLGGVAAAGVALWFPVIFPEIPAVRWLYLPLMLVVSMLAGAVWALIPALLKAYLKVNEIITTLMLNYIAILWYQHLFNVVWKDPEGYGFPGSARIGEFAQLPRLSGRLHWGLFVAIGACALVWLVLVRMRWGYEIRLVGENANAARYAGVSIGRNIVLVMLLSGGLAGIAGMVEVAGISLRLQEGLNVGYGFTGIIVAWLAALNPWAAMVVATLLAALLVGGDQIQMTMGLPASVALILQGAVLFCVLGGDMFTRYRLKLVRRLPNRTARGDGAHVG